MRLPPPDPSAPLSDFDVKDPNLRKLMGLPPLALPAAPIQGLPPASPFAGPLSTPGSSPQSAQQAHVAAPTPLGSTPQPPQYPNISSQMGALEQLRRSQADLGLNQFTQEQAQNQGQLADLQARLAASPKFDQNAAAYHWNAVQPQSLGTPQFAPVATRPTPGKDPVSMGLAALAGIFDPRGAGAYNAQPLHAGINVANQQYQDALQQNALKQQQYLQQYDAERANAAQNNQFATMNAQQQHQADLQSLSDQQRLGGVNAQLGGQLAGAQALGGILPGLAQKATQSQGYGANITNLEGEISAAQNRFNAETKLFQDQYGPYAKYLTNAATVAGRQGVAETNSDARIQSAQIAGDSRETVGQGHDTAHLQGINTQQSGLNQRNAANNAQSNTNNIRNNSGAPDGGVTDANLLKVPEVAMANSQYMKTLDVYNKLLAQQARDHNPTPLGRAALTQTQQDLRSAKAYLDQVFVKARAAQTPTPAGVGGTTNNTTSTAPGAPPGFSNIRIR